MQLRCVWISGLPKGAGLMDCGELFHVVVRVYGILIQKVVNVKVYGFYFSFFSLLKRAFQTAVYSDSGMLECLCGY